MSRILRPRATLAVVAAALIAVFGFAAPAAAHTAPIPGGVPADGATVDTAPKQVTIEFAGQLLTDGAAAEISTDATGAGKDWTAGAPTVDGTTLTIPVDPEIPAGTYTVTFHVVAEDGHAISQSSTFTYAPAADAGSAPADETPSATADATATPTTQSTATAASGGAETSAAAAADDGAAPSALPWIIGGGIVVAVALIVALAMRSRPRRD